MGQLLSNLFSLVMARVNQHRGWAHHRGSDPSGAKSGGGGRPMPMTQLREVGIHPEHHGEGIKIHDGGRVTGSGTCLSRAPLQQDRAYFECRVVSVGDGASGQFCVGVCRRPAAVEDAGKALGGQLGFVAHSWGLRSTSAAADGPYREGDVLACTFDQNTYPACLTFFKNGKRLDEIRGAKGALHAAISVTPGTQLACTFSVGFKFPPPAGFDGVIECRSLV